MAKFIHKLKYIFSFTSQRKWPRPRFRLSIFELLLTFHFSLLVFNSCGLDIEDSTPPSPPVWVEKSLPEEWPERGIDAHESGGIFLEWEPSPIEENVTSYLLYRAEYFEAEDSLGDFGIISTLMVESSAPEYIDRNATRGHRYHYVLIAEDVSMNQSTSSDTLSYIVGFAAGGMLPNGISMPLESDRKLQWYYSYQIAMENYTMTILNAENVLILRHELLPGNYIGNTEYFTIPDTIILKSGEVYKWRVDMGAQYLEGCETVGSESPWATFLYNKSS